MCATKFIFDQRQQKLLNYKQYCVRGEERLCTVAFTFFSPTQHEAECMDGEEMQKSYHNTHTAEAKVIRWFKPWEYFHIRQNASLKRHNKPPVKYSWSKTRVHIPTFFFLLYVNECESMAVPFQSPLKPRPFPPVTPNAPVYTAPFLDLTWLRCHREAVRVTQLDI